MRFLKTVRRISRGRSADKVPVLDDQRSATPNQETSPPSSLVNLTSSQESTASTVVEESVVDQDVGTNTKHDEEKTKTIDEKKDEGITDRDDERSEEEDEWESDEESDVESEEKSDVESGEGSDDGSLFTPVVKQTAWNEPALCVHCRQICDYARPGQDQIFFHWTTFEELEDSAGGSCSMCAQFLYDATDAEWQYFKEKLSNHAIESSEGWVAWKADSDEDEDHICLTLTLRYLHEIDANNQVDLHLDESRKARTDEFFLDVVFLRCDKDTSLQPYNRHGESTESAVPLISEWLRSCRKTHWQCHLVRGNYHPTRLLTTDDACVRLVLKDEVPDASEYATLSHCWGQTRFETLQRQNIHGFRERIPDTALSKTFRDAIAVARDLGLSYIWIDSLCIIQDDEDDWNREAATMSAVYGASSLNIAASAAPDGISGCFSQTNLEDCLVRLEDDDQNLYRCVPAGFYHMLLTEMPLMRRAWAFQERLLSPRTVHFSSTQVCWECHQKVACESFPEQFPSSLTYTSYYKKQPVSRPLWNWIVEHYSGSEMTHSEDVLVAISGVARAIQLQTQDQYVAGLWRRGIEYQLSWERAAHRVATRVSPYRAPTWSWASLDCEVDWSHLDNVSIIGKTPLWVRVLDINLVAAGTDALGKLSSGSLRLGCQYIVDVTFTHRPIGSSGVYTSRILTREKALEAHISLDEVSDRSLHDAVALPFGDKSIGGLLVEETGRTKGEYKRLGVYRFLEPEYWEPFDNGYKDGTSWWTRSSKLVKVRKDKFGRTHRIINLV